MVFLLPVAAASAAQDAGDQAEQPPEHKPHICHFLHNRDLREGNFTLKKVRKFARKVVLRQNCVQNFILCVKQFFAFQFEYFTLG